MANLHPISIQYKNDKRTVANTLNIKFHLVQKGTHRFFLPSSSFIERVFDSSIEKVELCYRLKKKPWAYLSLGDSIDTKINIGWGFLKPFVT